MGKMNSRSRPDPSKSAARPRKAPRPDTALFACPFCGHHGSVKCRIDLDLGVAEASCGVCGDSYIAGAHALTAPVDVYGAWFDACQRANVGVLAVRPCQELKNMRNSDQEQMQTANW